MYQYLKLLRPKSWLKNVFVFIPITFALELSDLERLKATIIAFIAFCLISSAVYILNDICDAERDATHPVKCKRPIASGVIRKPAAFVFFFLLIISGFAIGYNSNTTALLFIAAYLAINLFYSFWLKHIPIFDCFCIAAGFVLRVFTGGASYGGGVSDWLFLTVVTMSLFMAFGKRRGELIKTDGTSTRVVLEHYNLLFLNGLMFACAGLSIVFYSLWAMSRGSYMIYTVPLIIFIVCKFLLLVCDTDSHGDPTTVIFSNKTLLISCVIYAAVTVGLLYMGTVPG